jgi:hypothetical protein
MTRSITKETCESVEGEEDEEEDEDEEKEDALGKEREKNERRTKEKDGRNKVVQVGSLVVALFTLLC